MNMKFVSSVAAYNGGKNFIILDDIDEEVVDMMNKI